MLFRSRVCLSLWEWHVESQQKEFAAREEEFRKLKEDANKRLESLYNYYSEQESRLATRKFLQSENQRLREIIENVKRILDDTPWELAVGHGH